MSAALELTSDERALLEQLLEDLSQETGRPVSFNDMLSRWRAFVSAVERGYGDSIYEYTNDLSVRDRLEAVLNASSSGLRSKLEEAISPIDRRFMETTEEAATPLSQATGDLASWWRRVPIRRVGELAEDLKALGHVG
jgi:hypothetical protein